MVIVSHAGKTVHACNLHRCIYNHTKNWVQTVLIKRYCHLCEVISCSNGLHWSLTIPCQYKTPAPVLTLRIVTEKQATHNAGPPTHHSMSDPHEAWSRLWNTGTHTHTTACQTRTKHGHMSVEHRDTHTPQHVRPAQSMVTSADRDTHTPQHVRPSHCH